jgi:transposase
MPCPVRAKCTKAANSPLSLTIQPQAAYEALQAARQRQKAETFREQRVARAGVEGTVSQGVAVADLRRARYVCMAKTRLQHIVTALGMNVLRLGAWWAKAAHFRTRVSPFGKLALAPAPT